MKIRYGALTKGVSIYAAMYLLWSGFTLYGFSTGALPHIVSLVVLVNLVFAAGISLRYHSWRDILPYSALWTITIAALDALFSVPFYGWSLYADWNLWVGYLLVLLVPLFAPIARRTPSASSVSAEQL